MAEGDELEQAANTARAGAGALKKILGDDLLSVYLHGSAVLGGFRWDRSDLDLLAVSRSTLSDAQVGAVGDALVSLPYPANGLEFSLLTAREAAAPELPAPRFQVHVATKGRGHAPAVIDGRMRVGDRDLVLHLAVCRARGRAITGPSPLETLGQVPEAALMSAMRDELDWAGRYAPLAYLVLTSARVWLFGETRRIASKIEAGEWAAQRYAEPNVIEAALAHQRGASDEIEPEAAQRLAEYVQRLARTW